MTKFDPRSVTNFGFPIPLVLVPAGLVPAVPIWELQFHGSRFGTVRITVTRFGSELSCEMSPDWFRMTYFYRAESEFAVKT